MEELSQTLLEGFTHLINDKLDQLSKNLDKDFVHSRQKNIQINKRVNELCDKADDFRKELHSEIAKQVDVLRLELQQEFEKLRKEVEKIKNEVLTNQDCNAADVPRDNLQGRNLTKQFPTFEPGGDTHPAYFLRSFKKFLPKHWEDSKKVDFVLSHLEGSASEWGIAYSEEFKSWKDFEDKFLNMYWSPSAQTELMLKLYYPPYYNESWGCCKNYVVWHLTRSKYLDNPIDEKYLIKVLISRLPQDIRIALACNMQSTVSELLRIIEEFDALNRRNACGNSGQGDHKRMDSNYENRYPPRLQKRSQSKYSNARQTGNRQKTNSVNNGQQITQKYTNGSM